VYDAQINPSVARTITSPNFDSRVFQVGLEKRYPPLAHQPSPPIWEMAVQWARVVGLVVAVAGLSLMVFAPGLDGDFGATLLVAWAGTAAYVLGSFALPDLRSRAFELMKVSLAKRAGSMWALLAPPEAPSPRRLPRILVAALAVAWFVLFVVEWVGAFFGL